MTLPLKPFYSTADFVRALRCSPSTARRRMRALGLPLISSGRGSRMRIALVDIVRSSAALSPILHARLVEALGDDALAILFAAGLEQTTPDVATDPHINRHRIADPAPQPLAHVATNRK